MQETRPALPSSQDGINGTAFVAPAVVSRGRLEGATLSTGSKRKDSQPSLGASSWYMSKARRCKPWVTPPSPQLRAMKPPPLPDAALAGALASTMVTRTFSSRSHS
eukprot:scaffold101679_cov64-Attheya_sp.AAC.4